MIWDFGKNYRYGLFVSFCLFRAVNVFAFGIWHLFICQFGFSPSVNCYSFARSLFSLARDLYVSFRD